MTIQRRNWYLDFLIDPGTLGASLLGNLLTGKGIKISKIPERGVTRAGKGTIRAGRSF